MRLHPLLLWATGLLTPSTTTTTSSSTLSLIHAFSYQALPIGSINLSSSQPRDISSLTEWAINYCGIQQCDGFTLVPQTVDGKEDYFAATTADLPAGSPILYVPSDVCITSSKVEREMMGALTQAESQLAAAKLSYRIPLFRIFCKILMEYERGQESFYYYWLNSLPKVFNNGASMTYACFDCLPPYAAWLSLSERQNFVNFQKAAKYLPLSEDILSNVVVLRWAYNVARTRSTRITDPNTGTTEYVIPPMADMFNHGTETEAELSFDSDGNCVVYATCDVPANSPLRISYGNPVNPSPLFAKYGFLDESSPATYCKLMHTKKEMEELGYEFNDLLFYKDTGDISPQVWDTILYYVLSQNDPSSAQGFYQAVVNGDEATKSEYHDSYFPYTLEEMKNHVDGTLRDLEKWSLRARSYDVQTHPRVPVILKHNGFVRETFLRVKDNLDRMG